MLRSPDDWWDAVDSPIGSLLLLSNGSALTGLYMEPFERPGDARHRPELLADTARQLREYFDRQRTDFDVPLAPAGSPFRQRVWSVLREIPYGTMTTYGALAYRLGQPTATRAVGAANGANPISIIVPCHRVVGSHGKLTGYGGGIERKATLLRMESGLPLPQPTAAGSD